MNSQQSRFEKHFHVDLCFLEIRGDINLGSICRLCENFSVGKIHLVAPKNEFSGQERSFACHGEHYLDELCIWDSFDEVLNLDYHYVVGTTGKMGKDREALSSTRIGELHHIFSQNHKILLVFGRESTGMHNSEVLRCHEIIHIPLQSNYPILNLSHALSILLYEIEKIKSLPIPEKKKQKQATRVEISSFIANMDECLTTLGYYRKKERLYHKKVLEGLILRKDLSVEEVRFLQGLVRVVKNHYLFGVREEEF